MSFALQKTLELLIIIFLGVLLKRKFSSPQHLKGIKTLILSLALPATIFIALMKINLDATMLALPMMAISFNLIMLLITKHSTRLFFNENESDKKLTAMMLIPSLAPGLSCFPFIVIYLGDMQLGLAALSDVGNKVFVLLILYLIAMHYYNANNPTENKPSLVGNLRKLVMVMFKEPINIVILVAMILLGAGYTLEALPAFMTNTIVAISVLTTPMVLLFIGLAVKVKFKEMRRIFFILSWRSGVAFCLTAICIVLLPPITPAMTLLLLVFPQSACSFWPFAHMNTINDLEIEKGKVKPTFDINFAVAVVACSLPFSTLLIITLFSFKESFLNPLTVAIVGVAAIAISLIPYLIKVFNKLKFKGWFSQWPVYHDLSSETSSKDSMTN